ncbi:Hypothetical protein A7982_06948 [Minicystis rosea]|nr:Hypothetical protein A7982_06948 [Minicystis rosea]
MRLRLSLRLLLTLCLPLAVLLFGARASAYPWMIRHDYTVCSTCHVDPSGAGLMTPYGRAQSEVLLRTRYGAPPTNEDPAKLGGFLFGLVSLPAELLVQGDARGAVLRVQPPSPAPAVTRPVLMQADLAVGAMADRFRASVSLGYAHDGAIEAAVTPGEHDRVVSRQHWAGVVFGENDAFMLRAGRMNLPYGQRVIEHTLWIKSATRTDVNAAQQHGVALSFAPEGWRMEIMGILGNLQLSPPALRERGYAAYVERSFAQRAAIGLSSMITYASYDVTAKEAVFRQAHGLFARFLPAKPVVIMAEGDVLVRSPRGAPFKLGATGMLQVDVEPVQGVHLIGTGEVLDESIATQAPSLGGWLSLQWFFLPHVDLRFDFTHRNMAVDGGRAGITSLLGQIHVFL